MSRLRHTTPPLLHALPTSTQPVPQEQHPSTFISLKELFNERQTYVVYPAFQRQEVWPIRKAQALIDTILLGDPIPPIEAYQEFNADGEMVYRIIDGHQRISSIINFMDGVYKTWTAGQKRQAEPNSKPPVEPGRLFSQLSVVARNYLLEYRLQINKVRKSSEQEMVTRFLRIQNHVPLSAAEKLNAYVSKAKDAAKRIEQHPFWGDFYEGRTDREQKYQSCLYLLAIEIAPAGTANLHSNVFINALASGAYDLKITDAVSEAVWTRLDVVAHVYAGAVFTRRAVIIPMYQAVMFVERAGYTFVPKDKGRLTKWISTLIAESNRSTGVPSYNVPAQSLLRETAQREFWAKHRAKVLSLFGLSANA